MHKLKFFAFFLAFLLCVTPACADWSQYAGGGGGGGGSGTVGSGSAGQVAYYQSTGTTVIGDVNMTVSNGALTLGQSGTAGSVVLNGATSGTVTISVPAIAGTTTFQLPGSNGTNGQVLTTNGSGVLSWTSGAAGTGTVNAGTATQLTYYASSGSAVSGNANATITNGALTLGQSGTAGQVILNGSASGTVTLQTPATAGSVTFQFPNSNGTSGYVLTTNGAGVTSWTSAGSGSGTVNSGLTNELAYYVSNGTAVNGNTNVNITAGSLALGQAGTAGSLVLNGAASGTGTISVPSAAGSTTFELPPNNGTNGYVLQTNGSGVTSWVATSTGSGTVNSGTGGQGTYYATTGTAVSGNPNENWSTGTVTIGQVNTVGGAIVLEGSTSGGVTLNVPATAGSTNFTLPGSNGTNGYYLQTNGSGVTSWQAVSSSGTVNSGLANQITYYSSSGTAVSGNANVTAIAGALTLGQSGTAGSVVLNGSTSGTVTVGVPGTAGTTTFTLPGSNGTNLYFLQTNGSGVTSWGNVLPASATATTQSAGDNTTSVATDAFVTTAVNNAIAGVNPAVAVTAATTGVLPNSPTYNNGVSGVGATLTAGSNTTLTVDGVTFSALTQSILVKNQASAFQNGIYNVTQVGSGILPWILTRRIDYDQPSDINNTGAIPVISGTSNGSTSWVLTSTVNTVGTDALTYTQFTLNPTTLQSNTLANGNIWVGNGSNVAAAVVPSGDLTLANTGAATLATVNSNVGSFTSANITVNAKGLITAAANGSGGGGGLADGGAQSSNFSAVANTGYSVTGTAICTLPAVSAGEIIVYVASGGAVTFNTTSGTIAGASSHASGSLVDSTVGDVWRFTDINSTWTITQMQPGI